MSAALSLVVVTSNAEETLGTCLSSFRESVDEMVVMDLRSVDKTEEIAKQHGAIYCAADLRTRDVRDLKIEGAKLATGNWCLFVEPDFQLARPEKSRELCEFLQQTDLDRAIAIRVFDVHSSGELIASSFESRLVPRTSIDEIGADGLCISDSPILDGLALIRSGGLAENAQLRLQCEQQIVLLEHARTNNLEDRSLQYRLGIAHYRARRFTEAISVFAHLALDVQSEWPPIESVYWHWIQSLRHDERPLAEILQCARRALELKPLNPDLWFATGLALVAAEELDKAREYLERAKQLLEAQTDQAHWQSLVHRPWALFEEMGELDLLRGSHETAYEALRLSMQMRGPETSRYVQTLNTTLGLALDLHRDQEELDVLFEQLFELENAPLDMFFLAIRKEWSTGDRARAQKTLLGAAGRYPRVKGDSEYRKIAQELSIL